MATRHVESSENLAKGDTRLCSSASCEPCVGLHSSASLSVIFRICSFNGSGSGDAVFAVDGAYLSARSALACLWLQATRVADAIVDYCRRRSVYAMGNASLGGRMVVPRRAGY